MHFNLYPSIIECGILSSFFSSSRSSTTLLTEHQITYLIWTGCPISFITTQLTFVGTVAGGVKTLSKRSSGVQISRHLTQPSADNRSVRSQLLALLCMVWDIRKFSASVYTAMILSKICVLQLPKLHTLFRVRITDRDLTITSYLYKTPFRELFAFCSLILDFYTTERSFNLIVHCISTQHQDYRSSRTTSAGTPTGTWLRT